MAMSSEDKNNDAAATAANPNKDNNNNHNNLTNLLHTYQTLSNNWWKDLEKLTNSTILTQKSPNDDTVNTNNNILTCSQKDEIQQAIQSTMQNILNTQLSINCSFDCDELANLSYCNPKLQTTIDAKMMYANTLNDNVDKQLKVWMDCMRLIPSQGHDEEVSDKGDGGEEDDDKGKDEKKDSFYFFVPYETTTYILLGVADTLYRCSSSKQKNGTDENEDEEEEVRSLALNLARDTVEMTFLIPGVTDLAYAYYLNGQIYVRLGQEEKASLSLGRAWLLEEEEESDVLFGNSDDDMETSAEEKEERIHLTKLAKLGAERL